MADDANEGSAAMLGSAVLWDDPCLSAEKSPVRSHHSFQRVGSLGNSIDGSGSWVAVHLLDEGGNFIQGGWFPYNFEIHTPG